MPIDSTKFIEQTQQIKVVAVPQEVAKQAPLKKAIVATKPTIKAKNNGLDLLLHKCDHAKRKIEYLKHQDHGKFFNKIFNFYFK